MNRKTKAMLEIAQKSGDWESCLASFSEQQQCILRAIGNKSTTATKIAKMLMLPPRTVSAVISRLSRGGVLKRVSMGKFKVENQAFAAYLELVMVDPRDKEDVAIEAEKTAYLAMSPFFEALEHQGLIVGNGHHIAQAIATIAKETVLNTWRDRDEMLLESKKLDKPD